MSQRTLRIPGTLKHTGEGSDASLQDTAREHVERHPGLLFVADVMRALHAAPVLLRTPADFFDAFSPKEVMNAFAERPDLRVKLLKAMTGGPAALLRRLTTEAVAFQIDLLATDDLPEAERTVRAEADRTLSIHELYFKYVEPIDVATYVPAGILWAYEMQDEWWKSAPTAQTRALMAIELRSIRRLGLMTDSEILDVLGDETFERHVPLSVRTGLRKAARRAAAEGRPFTDADLFAGVGRDGSGRDLIDEMVESVPLASLREVVDQAARMLGLAVQDAVAAPLRSVANGALPVESVPMLPTPAGGIRLGPKPASGGPGLPSAGADKGGASAKPRPPALPKPSGRGQSAKAAEKGADAEGPPQPDDDLTFVEEISQG